MLHIVLFEYIMVFMNLNSSLLLNHCCIILETMYYTTHRYYCL